MKLKFKLALSIFILSFVVLVCTIGAVGFISISSTLHTALEENLENVEYVSETIEQDILDLIRLNQTIASSNNLKDFLESSNETYDSLSSIDRYDQIDNLNTIWKDTDDIEDPFIKERMENEVALYLETQQLNSPDLFGELFLTNKYGLAIATTGKLTTLAHSEKYWWRGAYNNGEGIVFIDDRGFDESVAGYVLGIVTPIYNDANEIIGILKCNYNITEIFSDSSTSFQNLGNDGSLYIVRTKGLIISGDSLEPLTESIDSSIIPFLKENTTVSFEHQMDESEYLLAVSPIEITYGSELVDFGGSYVSEDHSQGNLGEGWSLVSLVNQKSFFDNTRDTFVNVTHIGLIGILIISIIAFFVGQSLSKPITNLNSYIIKVGSGNLKKEKLKIYKDEIGDLTISFNSMLENLDEILVSKNKVVESEEKLKLILNSTSDGMYGVDLDGTCTFVNDNFLKILGYEEKSYFIGKHIHSIVHHHHIDGSVCPLEECRVEMATIIGKKVVIGEEILWTKDNTIKHVEFSSNPQFKSGEMIGAVVTFKDITEKLEVRSELEIEKDLAHKYLNTAEVIMLAMDLKGNITMMNKKGCSIIGLNEIEILGLNWFDNFISKTDKEEFKIEFEKTMVNRTDFERKRESFIITSSGEKRFISWTDSYLFDISGGISGILSSGEDITEISIVNEKLKQSEEKFRTLFEQAPFGYQSLDKSGNFIEVNKRWLEIFGYERDEVIGKWFGNFLEPKSKRMFKKNFEIFKEKGSIHSEFSIMTKAGKARIIGFDGNIGYGFNNTFKRTHCTVTDVTELNIANRELEYEKELAQRYLNLAGVMIIGLDKKGMITMINKEGCKIIGLEEADIIGKNLFDNYIPEADMEEIKKEFINIFKNGESESSRYENVIINANGERRYISWHNTLLSDSEENIIGIISSGDDVTESRNKQEILIENKNRLSRSQAIAQVGSWEVDLRTNIVWGSKEAFDIYDYPFSNNIDFGLAQAKVDDKYRETLNNAMYDLVNKGQEYDVTFALNTPKKVKWIHSKAEVSYDSNGKPIKVLGVIRDISESVEYEESLLNISHHDFLTGLYNRRFFVEKYKKMDNTKYYPLGVMMIDVNGLKIINDAFGHDVGDIALKEASRLLEKAMRDEDIIARIGGDEFAILLPNVTIDDLEDIKIKLKTELEKVLIQNLNLSLATGYDIKDANSKETLDDMLKTAENHMYRHKLAEGVSVRNLAIKAILKTLTDKYAEERIHSAKVSHLCKEVGKKLGLNDDDLNELELAGMYHDIGKISIPDAILNKPGKLTDEEYAVIKTHPEISYQILRAADEYSDLAISALYHHERWDGKGYPKGKKAEEIPLFSRIISVVDAFEAMTAVRVYKDEMSEQDAVDEIIRCSGTQFDSHIAKVFVVEVLEKSWKSSI